MYASSEEIVINICEYKNIIYIMLYKHIILRQKVW